MNMETTTTDRTLDRCPRLRSKDLYFEAVPDPTVPACNDQLFWCNETQTCLGPDGQPVDGFECRKGRVCYQRL